MITGWPAEELAGVAPYDGPVLWVRGDRSEHVARRARRGDGGAFPRVRKVTVKGAGHWVHCEQPAAFTSVVRQFLGD